MGGRGLTARRAPARTERGGGVVAGEAVPRRVPACGPGALPLPFPSLGLPHCLPLPRVPRRAPGRRGGLCAAQGGREGGGEGGRERERLSQIFMPLQAAAAAGKTSPRASAPLNPLAPLPVGRPAAQVRRPPPRPFPGGGASSRCPRPSVGSGGAGRGGEACAHRAAASAAAAAAAAPRPPQAPSRGAARRSGRRPGAGPGPC